MSSKQANTSSICLNSTHYALRFSENVTSLHLRSRRTDVIKIAENNMNKMWVVKKTIMHVNGL